MVVGPVRKDSDPNRFGIGEQRLCQSLSRALVAQHRICIRPRGAQRHNAGPQRRLAMLMTLVVILLVFWLLGMVTTGTLGGVLHVLLVIAVILVLVRVIQGRPLP